MKTNCIPLTEQQMKEKLQSALTVKRYRHSLGVYNEAIKLAAHYKADAEKAGLAGLLHDCAKDYPDDLKFRLAKEYHVPLDACIRSQPELIHSFLGAEVARREYGVADPEILQAIAYHTTGRANMTLLEKIIFLSDWVEPNRKEDDFAILLRRLVYEDLDEAMIQALLYSVSHLRERGKQVHPYAIEALHFLKKEK